MIELRRKYLGLSNQLHIFSVPFSQDEELEYKQTIQHDIDAMLAYFHNERMYLDPNLTEKARGICGGFQQHVEHMREARKADLDRSPMDSSYRGEFVRAREEMERWRDEALPMLVEDLEKEIHKLRNTRRTLQTAVRELFGLE